MRKLICALSILLFSFAGYAQRNLSLYNLKELPQSNYENPANRSVYNFTLGLPVLSNIYLGYDNNGFAYKDLFVPENDSLTLDIDNFLSTLKKKNFARLSFQTDLLHFSFKAGENYFFFNATEKVFARMNYAGDFFKLVLEGNGSFLGETASFNGSGANVFHYREYGVGYSRRFFEKWDLGIRLKYLYGMENIYTRRNDIGLYTDETTFDLTASVDAQIQTSGVTETSFEDFDGNIAKYLFGRGNNGFAVDLGANYELTEDINLSASVLDMGFIRWKNETRTYTVDDDDFTFSGLDINDIFGEFEGSDTDFIDEETEDIFTELLDSLENTFDYQEDSTSAYTTALPTRFYLGGTYSLTEKTNVGLTFYGEIFQNQFNPAVSVAVNTALGRWLNFTANYTIANRSFNNLGMGLTLRGGPIQWYIMSDNVVGLFAPQAVKMTNFRTGINLVFGYKKDKKPKDSDEDGVLDKVDDCVDVAGPVDNNGCPYGDMDEDGVLDNLDQCIDVPGPKENNGCPYGDLDGDSITDDVDNCIDVPGPVENNGCPYGDLDGDSILDNVDDCIDVPGVAENNGCPWPDKDQDGVFDKDDDCIDAPGPEENNGCPYLDTDGDSVLDKDDECPKTPGLAENNGCPVLKKEEEEVVKRAFDALEFDSGTDNIRSKSYTTLNELADLLKDHPDWGLKLAGHTDNVGSDEANMILSRDRAMAVKNYLTEKGVNGDKIVVEYYGEERPIANNENAEGRQKNRRVEMNIIFE